MTSRRSIIAIAIASITVLSACGASAPPAKELAIEMVDTMVSKGDVSESVGECMRLEIAEFGLTEAQATGFDDFDDVAAKADQGNEQAMRILGDFQSALATCN